MKRLIFAVLAVMVMAVPMANAQKVNKSAIEAKLEKADAAVADAKKGTKAATWIARGKAYYEAANVATKDLFVGMEGQSIKKSAGVEPSHAGILVPIDHLGQGAFEHAHDFPKRHLSNPLWTWRVDSSCSWIYGAGNISCCESKAGNRDIQ